MPSLRLSLRMKLTLWFLVIFAVVFSGLLVAAWMLHREAARRVLDSQLTMLARGVAEMLQASDREALRDGLSRFQPIDRASVVLAVRADDGSVLGAGWRVDPAALPPLREDQGIGQVVVHELDGEQARGLLGRPVTTHLVTYRFMMPDGAPAFLDLAGATDLREEEFSYIRGVFLVGGLGAVLAAGLAAWLIAGRAVQPMKQLARAAEQVDSDHFGARIELEQDEVEVARLKAALNEALNRLEEGYRAQERFVSNVAHDLKTPIAVMLAESQVLRPELVGPAEFEAYRASVIAEMRSLGGLVESFLALARADQGEILARMTEVSVFDILIDAVAESGREARRKSVHIIPTIDDPGPEAADLELHGDPDLLRAMLVNLLRNAVEFSPAGENVDARAGLEGECALLSVRDRGPGVPEDLRELIFDRFFQAPANGSRRSGSGLGLAIAKSVAELHGGSIGVENCPDGGCTFTVRLPLANGRSGDVAGEPTAEGTPADPGDSSPPAAE